MWPLVFLAGFLVGSNRKAPTVCEDCGGRMVPIHADDRSLANVWGEQIAGAVQAAMADGALAWVQYGARHLRLIIQPPGADVAEVAAEIPRA